MMFSAQGQAVLTMHERSSRLLIAVRPPNKSAEPVARAMYDLLAPLPPEGRKSVTFDNGTEFAYHYRLHELNIETFFCDTYSPWQKGGIENAIGRMRRTLPRKTDLAAISDRRFIELIRAYNHTPRKCLDYLTPAELFLMEVLHFKCESTPLPSQG
jgi:IS30 family transposase